MGRRDWKTKRDRRVTIFSPDDRWISPGHDRNESTQPMISTPAEHQYTGSELSIINREKQTRLSSKNLSDLYEEPGSSQSTLKSNSANICLTHDSLQRDPNLHPADSKKTEENNQDPIQKKKEEYVEPDVPIVESSMTVQCTKASTLSDIRSLSFNSLLQIEDKLDISAKLSTLDVTKDDETLERDEQLIPELKYDEVDLGDKISSVDMKTVDEYILERKVVRDSVNKKQLDKTIKQISDDKVTQMPDEQPSTSRSNRYFFHVRYKDVDSDESSDRQSLSDENLTEKKRIARQHNLITNEDTEGTKSNTNLENEKERIEKRKKGDGSKK